MMCFRLGTGLSESLNEIVLIYHCPPAFPFTLGLRFAKE